MASGYEIRRANVEEFETIRRMHAQSWLDTYGNDELGITHEWLTEYTDRWFEPENLERSRAAVTPLFTDSDAGFYRIALHDGKIIGFVTASVLESGRKELGPCMWTWRTMAPVSPRDS